MVFGLKQGQRRDVRMQRLDFPESEAANVVTLRSNVATFQRAFKTNVATLGTNVAMFQRRAKITSRRWNPTSRHFREGLIQRRDVPEEGKTDVVTLRCCDVATLQRGEPTS